MTNDELKELQITNNELKRLHEGQQHRRCDMTRDPGDAYKFDGEALRERFTRTPEGELLSDPNNKLDNGSTTDTQQWCELHRGHCNDVVPIRRCFDNPRRKSIIFFACQRCIRTLRKAELIEESKYAGLPCAEIIVPRGFSHSSHRDLLPIAFPKAQMQSYEVTLDALQVRYLRALGLRVIPA